MIFLRTDDDRLGAKTPKGQASPDAALAGDATGYHDTAVVPGTSYRYRISFARGVRPPLTATGVEAGPEPRDSDGDGLTDRRAEQPNKAE